MKVAFATDDRRTISKHTGRAKEFAVYELSAFEVISVEYYENKHEHSEKNSNEHSNEHSHKDIVEKIKDVDYIYLKHLGQHLKNDIEEAQIQYEFTNEELIDSVVQDFFEEDSA